MAEFDLDAVEAGIRETRFGGEVRHFRSVSSTNQLALEAAQTGATGGVWVADEQTAGRGRGGHQWHSSPGDGLYVSALVKPRIALGEAAKIPLAVGLACQAAMLETAGLRPDIRWPNDLMFAERKCGGILVESASENRTEPTLRYAVIGIGINVNHAAFPDELRKLATSLRLEASRTFEREPLLAALLRNLDRELALLDAGTADLLERFAQASGWVWDKRVTVDEGGGYTGRTRGLDANGFLLVEDDAGTMRTVLSGGVRSA
jgi:BirA family biotin operon repressor/biotin-[acetyl-CoA-carboxylase] ligase